MPARDYFESLGANMGAGRVRKDQWLQGALDFIVQHGVFGMTPERLAKTLGTSRSSYYWHFKTQADFRSQVVDFWIENYTGVVSDDPAMHEGTPEERLDMLLAIVHEKKLTRYEAAVHALAYGNKDLMRRIKKAYQARFEFIRSIIADTGMGDDELVAHTRLFLCYATWEAEMDFDWTERSYVRHSKLVASLVA